MANEMFTQLPSVGAAQMTDIICAVQGFVSPSSPGMSVQETLSQVLSLFQSNTIFSNSGNPNGSLGGVVNNLCWDSSDSILYICTTPGSPSSAVWTPVIGQLTNGQLRIGSTGNAPHAATLTAGPGISITNGAGSITISGTASGVGWNVVTTNTNMVADNGYICNSVSGITLTLPTTSAVGMGIAVSNFNTGGFTIAQNSGQNIRIGNTVTTTGVGGSIASTAQGDGFFIVCAVADTSWICFEGVQGNLTIV